MRLGRFFHVLLSLGLVSTSQADAQVPGQAQLPASSAAQAEPATKLEAFEPRAGSVLTTGYDELGSVSGVSIDAREMRGSDGAPVLGLVVQVYESQYRESRSFIDADEIPELLSGLDALLAVQSNPTKFKQFEVSYTTKGELRITVFNDSRGGIHYAVRAGRGVPASRTNLDAKDVQRIRELIAAADGKLKSAMGNP